MVISGVTYFPYMLTLKTPFSNSGMIIKSRSGYIIEITDNEGNTGTGEAAPFPESGSENLETARGCIHRIIAECPEEINSIDDIYQATAKYNDCPSARFCFEQALLNLLSASTNTSLYQLFNQSFNPVISVNALIGLLDHDEALESAREIISRGFSTIKVKAGRKSVIEDIKVITSISKAAGHNTKIRIDVNGAWDYTEAVNNVQELEFCNPEYIEQPVYSTADLIKIASDSRISIAADESIRNINDAKEFIAKKYCPVLVLKPMMLGSIIETAEIIRKAEANNIKTIISSSFESSIGFRALVFIASIVKEHYAHGLSTMDLFESDLYDNPFTVHQGRIKLDDPFMVSKV